MSQRTPPKILVDRVGKWFSAPGGKKHQVLADISLEINAGEFLCILGPSGCGKSTLINLMAGFDRPTEGSVTIDGRPVTGPDPSRILLFQECGLLPWRTALQNVLFGLEAKGIGRHEARTQALEYLRLVGLSEFTASYPHQLSGGMKQRVALARALSVHPDVLFMDEPFAALDTFSRYRLQDEVLRIWQEKGQTIVFVTHDLDEAVYLANRIVLLAPNPGRIKQVVEVRLSRPCERASAPFVEYRRQVFDAFELIHQEAADYAI